MPVDKYYAPRLSMRYGGKKEGLFAAAAAAETDLLNGGDGTDPSASDQQ
jgi:hypothetical protein